MQNNKVLSMLGLCMKAGRIKSGEFQVTDAVKSGKAWLVIVPEDASDNTKKQFLNMCEFYETPYWEYGSKEILGHAIGKEERSSVAICDEGFANSLVKIRDEEVLRKGEWTEE